MRNAILLISFAIIIVMVNYGIFQREKILTDGRSVLLELAPVDPRSLMQGDYMALRFKLADDAQGQGKSRAGDGRIVLAVDERGVGSFSRFDDGRPVAANEALVRYRIRNDRFRFRTFKIASNAFFFQEKQGHYYDKARYGEVRLAPGGEALLVALRGEDLQKLGPGNAVSQ